MIHYLNFPAYASNLSDLCCVLQAACYDYESRSQRCAGIQMINNLKIQPGNIVLDLGCGTGSVTKVLAERVGPEGKVVAVDPDPDRIIFAEERYSADNIEYSHADDKTFPLGEYDLVFCNATIHWIADKINLHKRVYDNLRPEGRFAFTTPDGQLPIPAIGRKLFDELVGPDFLHWMHTEVKRYLSVDDYKILASSTGFELSSVTTEHLYLKWRNLDHYISAMYGWFGGRFDPNQFDKDTLENLKKEYGEGPVVQTEPIRKLEVILTKPVSVKN